MSLLFTLLIVYQLKHFVADYPLQGKFMLGKFLPYPRFILPLLAHASVHGIFTFLIAICFKDFKTAIALAFFDFVTHFVVDRVKASPSLLGRFKALSATEMKTLVTTGCTPGSIAPVSQEKQAEALRNNVLFWWSLGFDQMAHHLTHYAIIWVLVS